MWCLCDRSSHQLYGSSLDSFLGNVIQSHHRSVDYVDVFGGQCYQCSSKILEILFKEDVDGYFPIGFPPPNFSQFKEL